jgi:hypothetical protein
MYEEAFHFSWKDTASDTRPKVHYFGLFVRHVPLERGSSLPTFTFNGFVHQPMSISLLPSVKLHCLDAPGYLMAQIVVQVVIQGCYRRRRFHAVPSAAGDAPISTPGDGSSLNFG